MSGRDAVAQLGIGKYNEECRSIVMKYASDWRQTIERLGRWIDFDNDYKVHQPSPVASPILINHRQWTPRLWNRCGGCSKGFTNRETCIDRIRSCHILQH